MYLVSFEDQTIREVLVMTEKMCSPLNCAITLTQL